jgi:nucleoside-diphosphate-sugar epimerase
MGKWMWAIYLRGKSGEAYEVGSDEPITMLELAQSIIKRYNSKSTIEFIDKPNPMPIYLPTNTEKTKGLL